MVPAHGDDIMSERSIDHVASSDAELTHSVAKFLYREAELLDAHDYEAWYRLFAEDGVYWIPINVRAESPDTGLNIVYSDQRQLQDRVARLTAGYTMAQSPPSQTTRCVTNLTVDDGPLVVVQSTFMLVEIRHGHQRTFAGRYTHTLRSTAPDTWEIVRKRVDLLGADTPLGDLSFLL